MKRKTERRELDLDFKIIDDGSMNGMHSYRIVPEQAFFILRNPLSQDSVRVTIKYEIEIQ